MKRGSRWMVATSPLVILLLSACAGQVSDEQVLEDPATVEQVEGRKVARITLTERATERLDIRTATVESRGTKGTVVPTDTTIVDPQGAFWVYTNPEPFVYVRHKIKIADEVRDQTFLSAGPPAGTLVVTVGVAELYGVEHGIGH
jgi:hypothetical protein